jgi:hypothetical protein
MVYRGRERFINGKIPPRKALFDSLFRELSKDRPEAKYLITDF